VSALVNLHDIAGLLGMEYRQVRDRVTKRPDFPRPALNLSQRTRRWDRSKVQAWIDAHAKRNER